MKIPKLPNEPDHIDTATANINPLWYCSECTGKEKCNQPQVGFYKWKDKMVRCKYNLRGYCNNDEILEEKYKTFECDNLDEIKVLVNKYHNLYLYGTQGYGKTHFLKWLGNKYNLMGKSVYLSKWSEINKVIQNEPRPEYREGKSMHEILKQIDILMIDDLGNETMTPQSAEMLSVVIDYRYVKRKPTFIASNYSIDELGKHYNDTKYYGQAVMPYHLAKQITTRLDDKDSGVIEIKGKNWRGSE